MKRTQAWTGLAIVLAVSLAGCGGTAASQWTYAPAPSAGVAAQPSTAPGSQAPAASASPAASQAPSGDVLGTLEVTGVDLGFKPSELLVDAVGAYEVKLVNTGSIVHDMTFPDGTKIQAQAGETASAVVQVPAEGLSFLCSIPGHADAGMKGTISVKGTAAGGDSHGGPAPATDVQPDPNAPKYTLFDPKAPALLPGDSARHRPAIIEEKR